jgi:NAD kinase
MYEKLVVITRKTRLEELVERFNSVRQAQFYIESAGGDFKDYVQEDAQYRHALEELRSTLALGVKVQVVERQFLPTFLFSGKDLIVTLGQDGLVANTAKYAGAQPIVAVNPDPGRFDGILLPFEVSKAREVIQKVLEKRDISRAVTLANVELNDGQKLLAFNELYIGVKSHVSARYRIRFGDKEEPQSSSGLIVATGAGSTGWLSSVFNMAFGVTRFAGGQAGKAFKLEWEDPRLLFVVREPFQSKHSRATLVAGWVEPGKDLMLESLTPRGGVIFSDGIENDFLEFNSGARAVIRAAKTRARLVTG